MQAIDLVIIFALFAYMGKMQKNKTNTDPNHTTNPKLTIDKAPKQKELNKEIRYRYEVTAFQWPNLILCISTAVPSAYRPTHPKCNVQR